MMPLIDRTGIVIERSQSLANMLKGRTFLRHPIEAIVMLLALNPDWNHVEQLFMNESKFARMSAPTPQVSHGSIPEITGYTSR